MGRAQRYDRWSLEMLAMKLVLVFAVVAERNRPEIFSWLLGGGAFRNNRPLVLLLHFLLQPIGDRRPVTFHHPIF